MLQTLGRLQQSRTCKVQSPIVFFSEHAINNAIPGCYLYYPIFPSQSSCSKHGWTLSSARVTTRGIDNTLFACFCWGYLSANHEAKCTVAQISLVAQNLRFLVVFKNNEMRWNEGKGCIAAPWVLFDSFLSHILVTMPLLSGTSESSFVGFLTILPQWENRAWSRLINL